MVKRQSKFAVADYQASDELTNTVFLLWGSTEQFLKQTQYSFPTIFFNFLFYHFQQIVQTVPIGISTNNVALRLMYRLISCTNFHPQIWQI